MNFRAAAEVARGGLCSIFLLWLTMTAPAAAQIGFATDRASQPVVLVADQGTSWLEEGYEVWWLQGRCRLRQGPTGVESREAIVWIERGRYGDRTGKVVVYAEGDLSLHLPGLPGPKRLPSEHWLTTFDSAMPLELQVPRRWATAEKPALYNRALAGRVASPENGIIRTQFTELAPPASMPPRLDAGPPIAQAPANMAPPSGSRRLRAFPRYQIGPSITYFPNERANEWVALVTGGVNLIIEGVGSFGTLDISADRVVVWTVGDQQLDLSGQLQSQNTPLEIYLEGNIIFRQSDRRIEAQRMYYNVSQQRGIVLEADLLSPVPNYQGMLRMRASVLEQLGPDQFLAQDAFLTSSRLGRPGYRLASGEIYFEDQQRPVIDPFTGDPQVDPLTGEPIIQHDRLATSTSNFLYVDELPVFYWPTLATDLEEPEYYIKRARFAVDRIFGTQLYLDFDAYQLFGIRNPLPGTEWDISLDYLSKRGPAAGTNFKYNREGFFDLPGPVSGMIDAWAIYDEGLDRLGSDRINLPPEETFRYRLLAQHRQLLPNNFQLTGEIGLISDRNFLEQYYESEWDQLKDQTTGLELKQIIDNMSWSIAGDVRLNDFFTQTEGIRLEHFWLGQSLWQDRLTWYEHSSAGYLGLATAEPPKNPMEQAKFGLLPWEADVDGERLFTRQEIDYPIDAGPVKLVPFALGELAHWGQDLSGDDLQRAYGQIGLRASLPIWTSDNEVEDLLFNVHGLAHKVVFNAELSFSDATRDLGELPLYDPLDDDNVEQFRRRFAFNTFGVPPAFVPPMFDARSYALRSGLGSWVTSPSMEVADDLAALRLGARQRWQTKRGLPGQRRIIDWIVLDTEVVYFPNDERDNFGESLGLAQYDFRWHVGDRTTIVSDGIFDFFDEGQEIFSIGTFLQRPPRGSVYLGYQSLRGPIQSEVLSASYSYRMSPKWISSFGTSFDIAGNGNIGQNIGITRIGESFLMTLGINVDAGKGNTGFNLAIEPRFFPRTRLGRVAGAQVPIAGTMGLE